MICIACTFSVTVNAQLQVNSNGQTKVTKQLAVNGANITDSVALNVNAAITSGSKNMVYTPIERCKILFLFLNAGQIYVF